jgi:transposase
LATFTFEKLARRLPDELWRAFEPVLPAVVWCGVGRPPASNRRCLHAAIYVGISGVPWKLMPACFPSYRTVQSRLRRWVACDAFRAVWARCAATYEVMRGVNFDQLSIDGARKPAKKGGTSTGPNPTDRGKKGTQLVIVASADDLPLGVAVCGADRQDATFTGPTLDDLVVRVPVDLPVDAASSHPQFQFPTPVEPDGDGEQVDDEGGEDGEARAEVRQSTPPTSADAPRGARADGKLSTGQRAEVRRLLREGRDVRSLPYMRGDGNFAKDPARLAAKRRGFRLWAPARGQSRRGLGRVRSSVERAHALLNQFGRVFRRLDRDERRYLNWAYLAAGLIFMRQGFFP